MASNSSSAALTIAVLTTLFSMDATSIHAADSPEAPEANLAIAAKASTSYVSGHETLTAVQNDFTPADSNDKSQGAYGNWPKTGAQWVQYTWSKPVHVGGIQVYWFDDHQGVRLPASAKLQAWLDGRWQDVQSTDGESLGLKENAFNALQFAPIWTDKLRLDMTGQGQFSTGVLVWKVEDAGGSPAFAPVLDALPDRVVVPGAKTSLRVTARSATAAPVAVSWSQASGPASLITATAKAAIAARERQSRLLIARPLTPSRRGSTARPRRP